MKTRIRKESAIMLVTAICCVTTLALAFRNEILEVLTSRPQIVLEIIGYIAAFGASWTFGTAGYNYLNDRDAKGNKQFTLAAILGTVGIILIAKF